LAVTKTGQRRLTLFVRDYCHLCDDMRQALSPLAAMFGWEVDEIDIDADAALQERWGERVPVLLAGERELCHYRIDAAAVTAFLVEAGANSR
jgi:thioredoxin reductase (NADPH)